MQKVVLNYKMVNRNCYHMTESGLLLYNPQMRTFHITEKGRLVLHNCVELARYISPVYELINKYKYGYTPPFSEGFGQPNQATSAAVIREKSPL